jgi:hypothetical protein
MTLSAKPSNAFIGSWTGTKTLFTNWLPQREHVSTSAMTIRNTVNPRFLHIDYTWHHEDRPQTGSMLLGIDPEHPTRQATAGWVDSWHQGRCVMACAGEYAPATDQAGEAAGKVTLHGRFEVTDSPDWGWRIEFESTTPDALRMRMHNISPDGDEVLAVDAWYRRQN